jgi:hypothetical protein
MRPRPVFGCLASVLVMAPGSLALVAMWGSER